ncbi:hypothetical protein GC170_00225 [bacterium]|nr:hypothetical protein [bacterium]
MTSIDYRHWLLTWTTYGSWVPGDDRGSTSVTRSPDGILEKHNRVGPFSAPSNAALASFSHEMRKHPIVMLDHSMAELVEKQLQETASYRGWSILILAIMTTHIHLVLQVKDDPKPSKMLKDLKSYASRRLNRHDPTRSGRWWTDSGSARFLAEEANVTAAIAYVRNQPNSLLVRGG